ncbi:hypothetical protein PQX77_004752 [Marasmius sp. AFHP31]|nr:hypothetical protein PQX77_004752 [Marasmius sp. AFHP31]
MKTANSSPPPPYASSFLFSGNQRGTELSRSTILGSPISTALQMVAQEAQDNGSDRVPLAQGEILDWLKDKSHEEISELLVKADEVIKQRESDLNRTNTLCKSLYDDNSSLQSKHKALLSRLPSTPRRSSESPLPSPGGSVFSSFSSRHHSSPSTDSLIHTPPISRGNSDQDPFQFPSRSTPSKQGGRHVRRISVTPYDISQLSEQNEELLFKVEKLESESASQDLAGRKMLRKLEKEINGLRAELEAVREKEALNAAKAAESAQRGQRQKTRKVSRSKSGPVSLGSGGKADPDEPVMDFAPAGPLEGLFNRSTTSLHKSIPESEEDTSESEPNTPTSATTMERQQREFIAQVLAKMAELEETNTRLESQQAETAAQLASIQKETESLGRVYEGLENITGVSGEGLELVHDDPSSQQENEEVNVELPSMPSDSTIRFQSFRKTLEGLPQNLPGDDSRTFTSDSVHPFTNRPRKTVLGLFEESLPSPSVTTPRPTSHADGLPSPLSGFGLTLNPLDSFSPVGSSFVPLDSLSSELGLGGTSGFTYTGPSDHLRTSSLCDFSALSSHANDVPSPSPSPVDLSMTARQDAMGADDGWNPNFRLPKTPVRRDGLQLTLEPPTPNPDEFEPQSPAQKQAERYRRMSQTVRARTARWVDGRFGDNLLSPQAMGSVRGRRPAALDDDEEITGNLSLRVDAEVSETSSNRSSKTAVSKASPSQPIQLKLTTVLDSVVERFTGRSGGGDEATGDASEEVSGTADPDSSVELYVTPASPIKEKKPAGVGEIILEVWLWLQFAVIILVFLWAMAKRGPKSVLGDKHRSVSSSTRARGP